jgi:hypothetical protein
MVWKLKLLINLIICFYFLNADEVKFQDLPFSASKKINIVQTKYLLIAITKKPNNFKLEWFQAKQFCDNLVIQNYRNFHLPSPKQLKSLATKFYGKFNDNWFLWFKKNKHLQNNHLFLDKKLAKIFPSYSFSLNYVNGKIWTIAFDEGNFFYTFEEFPESFICVQELN